MYRIIQVNLPICSTCRKKSHQVTITDNKSCLLFICLGNGASEGIYHSAFSRIYFFLLLRYLCLSHISDICYFILLDHYIFEANVAHCTELFIDCSYKLLCRF